MFDTSFFINIRTIIYKYRRQKKWCI